MSISVDFVVLIGATLVSRMWFVHFYRDQPPTGEGAIVQIYEAIDSSLGRLQCCLHLA